MGCVESIWSSKVLVRWKDVNHNPTAIGKYSQLSYAVKQKFTNIKDDARRLRDDAAEVKIGSEEDGGY